MRKKVIKLLGWVFENIKQQPKSLPVMDEHVWSAIVRGYGVGDNFHDIFTTLCNYAGLDAYFDYVQYLKSGSEGPMSFVQVDGSWTVFDPYNGVYFRNKLGNIASIWDMKAGDIKAIQISNVYRTEIDYTVVSKIIPDTINFRFARANAQSPVNRLLLQFRRWWGGSPY